MAKTFLLWNKWKVFKINTSLYQSEKSCVLVNNIFSDNCFQINYGNNLDDRNFNLILKLFILLYIDDSVIFVENPEELQLGLSKANEYCRKWDLKLNLQKIKIVFFF